MTLGANNLVAEVHGVALSVLIACGKFCFYHHFNILLLSQSETVIFGCDMLKKLSFEMSATYCQCYLRPLILTNSFQLGFLLLFTRMLHLNMNNHQPIFQHQYLLPNAYHAVNEQIESWAKHQVIIPAPDDCPLNSPILAIPKKETSG
ncbi:hypothetical protein QOT17_004527 [Balamuthia mandrillaris]